MGRPDLGDVQGGVGARPGDAMDSDSASRSAYGLKDFRRVLVEQVDGRNLISDTSIFESRALRADESIPDYVNVLRDLAAKSLVKYDYEQREDQVARQFKRGLTGVLRQEVLKSDFMEIDKLQAKAISFVTLSG